MYASTVSATFTTDTVVSIDENIVTANLIEVWYSVVKPGQDGNLPDHFHSNTEGDGGYIIPTVEPTYTFLDLTDTPSTYSGTESMQVISTGSGIIWSEISSDSGAFIDLIDTPTTYSGIEGGYIRTTSSGLNFIDGIVVRAPNESEWLIQVTNSGTLYTTGM